MIHKELKLCIPSYIDTDITLKEYSFSFTIPEIFKENDELLYLITNEIMLQSYKKLKEHMKYVNENYKYSCLMYEMPQKNLSDTGQISSDIILSKYTNNQEINIAYKQKLEKDIVYKQKLEKSDMKKINHCCCSSHGYINWCSPPLG